MSSFLVNPQHIHQLVAWAANRSTSREAGDLFRKWGSTSKMGMTLAEWNVKSVTERYGGTEPFGVKDSLEYLTECSSTLCKSIEKVGDMFDLDLTTGDIISMLICLEYQSADTEAYRGSPAEEIIKDLLLLAARMVYREQGPENPSTGRRHVWDYRPRLVTG